MRPSDPRNPSQSLTFLIHDVARMVRRNFTRRASGLGLTQAQWQALAHLSKREGIRQAALADLMEIQPITLGRLIDKLEAADLVERRKDPSDRRAIKLYLSEGAHDTLERMWELAAETRAEALAGISPETLETVIGALSDMRTNLIAAEAESKAALRPIDEDSK
jgi:DNA-binding MarR family transcriptional regulator